MVRVVVEYGWCKAEVVRDGIALPPECRVVRSECLRCG
jgi:hypothetical protein